MTRLIPTAPVGDPLPIYRDHLTLGGGADDDLVLDGAPEGACSLSWEPTGWTVQASEGAAVTVNGAAVSSEAPAALLDGSRLVLGEVELVFSDAGRCPLTGLPAGPAVDAALAAIAAGGGEPVLFCLEVDRYDLLRDVKGVEAVDLVTRAVASSLREALPDGALLTRERGGGFSAAFDARDVRAPKKLAGRLCTKVRGEQVDLVEELLEVSLSVGVARGGEPANLRHAGETALREAQRRGGGQPVVAGEGTRGATADDSLSAGFMLSPDGLGLLGLVEQVLSSGRELQPLLDLLLGLLVERTKAERGILFLAEQGGELAVAAARSPGGSDDLLGLPTMAVSRSLVNESARKRQPILVSDALSDARYRDRESVVRSRLRSALLVPLVVDRHSIGVIYLDNNSVTQGFTPVDQHLLQAFARLVAGPVARTAEASRGEPQKKQADSRRPAGGTEGIVGESDALLTVLARVERFADNDAPLVVRGESGTGKELLAQALHQNSPRRDGPFVAEGCATIPETLLEATLFGYEKGAFSGAEKSQPGLFERADGGTLFLDDLDEMPEGMQADLLRVLQEGEVRRLGAAATRSVSLRVMGASKRPLKELVNEGQFREDLFYRLNVLELVMPPLRDRREDIPLLVRHFVQKHAGSATALQFSAAALKLLSTHEWPGNVRQLENELKRLIAVMGQGEVDAKDLSPDLRGREGRADVGSVLGEGGTSLKDAVEALERKMIVEVLERARGNRSLAARMLGLSRSGLHLKLQRYGLG